jgi:hypothetical protein
MESEQVRSIVLAALMVGSVMVGIFYIDIEGVQPDQPPIISGEEPGSFVIGDVNTITITIDDEKLEDILLDVTLNGDRVANSFLDEDGKLIVDISQLGAGEHVLKVFAKDILDQETRWFTEFSITYPEEGITEIVLDTLITNIQHGEDAILSGNLTHSSVETCIFDWSDGDLEESQLAMPMDETGDFYMEFANMQENVTISMEATCGINVFTTDSVSITYIVEIPEEEESNGTDEGGDDGSDNGTDEGGDDGSDNGTE